MSTIKGQTAPTIRPEQYHLNEAPKMRAALREQADQASAKETALRRVAAARAIRKRLGITIRDDAEFLDTEYRGRNPGFRIGDVSVSIDDDSFRTDSAGYPASLREAHTKAEHLSRRATAVCRLIATTSARAFGAFCRTKYGPKPTLATIRAAHAEWLELQLNCKC